jgi:tRNA threonylcarbamoyl adenosine modification protein YeaZ
VKPILAIDTTTELGSIALAQDDRILEQVSLRSPDGFSQILFGQLEALLQRHGLTWRDLEGFAAAAGPGAFTGVRIGLAAAKGLAEAANRKLVAVSNLKALAWFGTQPLRAPMLDARRGDIFGAVYNAQLHLIQPETVQPLAAFLATLHPEIERIAEPRELAPAIARIAMPIFAAGAAQDPAEIDANYILRPSVGPAPKPAQPTAPLDESAIYPLIGEAGFQRLVAAFYRQVPSDEILGPMYPAHDLAAAEQRLRDFLIFRFGGPPRYIEQRGHPRLRQRHFPFAITPAARDRWVALMTTALEQAALPPEAAALLLEFFQNTATFLKNR